MSNFRQASRVCTVVTTDPYPAWPAWKSVVTTSHLKVMSRGSCFSAIFCRHLFLMLVAFFIFISNIQLRIELNFSPSFMVRDMVLIQVTASQKAGIILPPEKTLDHFYLKQTRSRRKTPNKPDSESQRETERHFSIFSFQYILFEVSVKTKVEYLSWRETKNLERSISSPY